MKSSERCILTIYYEKLTFLNFQFSNQMKDCCQIYRKYVKLSCKNPPTDTCKFLARIRSPTESCINLLQICSKYLETTNILVKEFCKSCSRCMQISCKNLTAESFRRIEQNEEADHNVSAAESFKNLLQDLLQSCRKLLLG